MGQILSAVFLIAIYSVASAADLISCLDPTVRDALVFNDKTVSITDRMPDDFPDIHLPREFGFIGAQRWRYGQRVAYEIGSNETAARDGLSKAMTSAGWVHLAFPQDGQDGRGGEGVFPFRRKSNNPHSQTYCNDTDGYLEANFRSAAEGTFVILLRDLEPVSVTCTEQQNYQTRPPIHLPIILPRVDLPGDAGPLFSGSASASGDQVTASGSFQSEWALETVQADFDRQIAEQGWEKEGGWNGKLHAGSAWRWRERTTLQLTVIQFSDGYDAILNAQTQ